MEPKQICTNWNQFTTSKRAARDDRRITLLDQMVTSGPTPSTSQAQNPDLITPTSSPIRTFFIKRKIAKNKSNIKPPKKPIFAFFQKLVPPKLSVEDTRIKIPVSEYTKGEQSDAIVHTFNTRTTRV